MDPVAPPGESMSGGLGPIHRDMSCPGSRPQHPRCSPDSGGTGLAGGAQAVWGGATGALGRAWGCSREKGAQGSPHIPSPRSPWGLGSPSLVTQKPSGHGPPIPCYPEAFGAWESHPLLPRSLQGVGTPPR